MSNKKLDLSVVLNDIEDIYTKCKEDGWLDGEGKGISYDSYLFTKKILSNLPLLHFPYLYPDFQGYIRGEYTLPVLGKEIILLFLPNSTVEMVVVNVKEVPRDEFCNYLYQLTGSAYLEIGLLSHLETDLNRLLLLDIGVVKETL